MLRRLGLVALPVVFLSSAVPAAAEETSCAGVLRLASLDDVRVPAGAACRMSRSRVAGSVVVESGATFQAKRTSIAGNVQGDDAAFVQLIKVSVGGSVQLVHGGSAQLKKSSVRGDVQFEENSGSLIALHNRIGGSLQVFQNASGGTLVKNRINGNLQCSANGSAPVGGRNAVGGSAEDQCGALARAGVDAPRPGTPGGPACSHGAVTLGDDFEIPAFAHCTLTDTHVAGSIKLNRGSRLDALRVLVDGNVQGQHAHSARIEASRVEGSVQLDHGGAFEVLGSDVTGSVQLVANDGDLRAEANRVGGDLQAFDNRAPLAIVFADNQIDGNLQCKQNAPAPTGGGNLVGGNKEDQCAGL